MGLLILIFTFLNVFTWIACAWLPVKPRNSANIALCMSECGAGGAKTKSGFKQLAVPTKHGISFHDITADVQALVTDLGIQEGQVSVLSRHTTTAITINEMEHRLVDDARQFLLKLAPPAYPYLHNDLHLRSGPPDWPGGDEAWRKQEPINCHSHLLAMLVGVSETIPVHEGKLQIGTWQSVIMVELDGPRTRNVAVSAMGI